MKTHISIILCFVTFLNINSSDAKQPSFNKVETKDIILILSVELLESERKSIKIVKELISGSTDKKLVKEMQVAISKQKTANLELVELLNRVSHGQNQLQGK
jgi:hypothetical protein